MSAGEPEEITLYSQLADWDDDSPEERGDGDDDLDFDCESSMMVERLGPNRMRLLEPCSITPFGPYGPTLNLGDVIEATPLEGGGYRYVRTVQEAWIWSAVFQSVSERAMRAFDASPLATELAATGGMWEWSAGNLTAQLPREGNVAERPSSVTNLFVRIDRLLRSLASANCPFCEAQPERVFHEGRLVRGLWDNFPVSPGHALLVPRRHVATWFDASAEERRELTDAIELAREAILLRHRPDGFNVGMNLGAAAGQTVPHLHLHVIPRYTGDVEDPRGGVRWVVPDKAAYWKPK